jgi:hypothetical protein
MTSLLAPLLPALVLDLLVLVLVVVLFYVLKSQATATGQGMLFTRWQASGALAGFVILMAVQLGLIRYFTPECPPPQPSHDTVRHFYTMLQRRDYWFAWGLLSPAMQQRVWKGDVKRFVSGYDNTQRISMLAIAFVSAPSEFSHDYVVYYQDETSSPVLRGLDNLSEWKISRLPQLVEGVADLKSRLSRAGLDPLVVEDMKIIHLFAANRGDILRVRIQGAPTDGVDAVFAEKKTVSAFVGHKVVVALNGQEWLIEKIDRLPYYIE